MTALPIGHPDAEPADMGELDVTAHRPVYAPLMDGLPVPRRVEKWCGCGWHEANHPGFTVADHLWDRKGNTTGWVVTR